MITLSDVTEHAPLEFCAEASSLSATRQGWPLKIPTSIGNGLDFVRTSKKVDREGDVLWVTYKQAAGCCILRIYND